MSKYLRLQSTTSRLIKANGAQYTIRKKTTVSDPIEGTVDETVETTQAYAVVLPPASQVKSLPVLEYLKQEGGVLTLSSINNILIAVEGLSFNLEPMQEIMHEGEWKILEFITPLKLDGSTVVLYKGFIRRV